MKSQVQRDGGEAHHHHHRHHHRFGIRCHCGSSACRWRQANSLGRTVSLTRGASIKDLWGILCSAIRVVPFSLLEGPSFRPVPQTVKPAPSLPRQKRTQMSLDCSLSRNNCPQIRASASPACMSKAKGGHAVCVILCVALVCLCVRVLCVCVMLCVALCVCDSVRCPLCV